MDPDEAFISGFVHDVGKIVLHMTDEKKYTKVIDAVDTQGADILEVERKYFDSDHVKTGSLLAKRWQLPILLANTITYHHAPGLSSIPIPCNLVCFIDKIVQTNLDVNAVDKDFCNTLGIDIEDLEDLREAILQKAEVMISQLS
jgi:HD-like signal output (HDOD) protein